jgi:uncharacterized membrane protein
LTALHTVRASYLALVLLQPLWHFLLPQPVGNRSWLLASIATVPLLLPFRGVWRASLRSITWAGYLSMAYLIIGIMEAWANPPQRAIALSQTVLVCVFVGGALAFSRPSK